MTQNYIDGFRKTAERFGVNAAALEKEAGISETLLGSNEFPFDPGILQKLLANEHLRRSLVGATAAGTAAAVSSRKNRWRNALIAAGIGGAATYGVSETGALDNLPRAINAGIREMKARDLTWKTHGAKKQIVDPRKTLAFLQDFNKRHAPKIEKEAGIGALIKNIPRAFNAAKVMTSAGALGAKAPQQLVNRGMSGSVWGNLKNLMARSGSAERIADGRKVMQDSMRTLAKANGQPFPPPAGNVTASYTELRPISSPEYGEDGSILLRSRPAVPNQTWDTATPQAQRAKYGLVEFLKRRFPGYEKYEL